VEEGEGDKKGKSNVCGHTTRGVAKEEGEVWCTSYNRKHRSIVGKVSLMKHAY